MLDISAIFIRNLRNSAYQPGLFILDKEMLIPASPRARHAPLASHAIVELFLFLYGYPEVVILNFHSASPSTKYPAILTGTGNAFKPLAALAILNSS